jgi:hypothetical protein
VLDNVSGLTWQRAETTYTGANAQGAQYTQLIAQTYCTSQGMRLPTQAEALGISGTSSASCAFPQPWSTWTSTIDPANSNDVAFVIYTGQSSWQVANNFPGGVVCDSGSNGTPPPSFTTQPSSKTVAIGETATFTVVASGSGSLTYQWYKNGSPITGATTATYTTPAAAAGDNGAAFNVLVANAGGAVNSSTATLTVTGGTCTAAPSTPGTLSATTMSATQIKLSWVASTAESVCPVNYDIFRSTTTGFTPSAANQIGAAQPGTTYTDTGLTAGTTYYYVVEAVDSSGTSMASNQASAMTPAAGAPAPDFMVAVTPNAVTVAAGSSGMTTVTLEPQNGFSTNSAVSFTCSGLPTGATCNFSPVTVSSTGSMSSTVTVNTTVASAAISKSSGLWFSGSSLAVVLGFAVRSRRRRLHWMLLLPSIVVAMTLIAGCTKSSSTTNPTSGGTPTASTSTTSTVTVTATSGSLMHTATFSLTVTPTT